MHHYRECLTQQMVLNIFGATVAFTNGTRTGLNLRESY